MPNKNALLVFDNAEVRQRGKQVRNQALKPPGGSKPKGDRAVMSQRHEAPGALDDYPTPPWATRALVEQVLLLRMHIDIRGKAVLEPCANRGIMSAVLQDYGAHVQACDVHRYCDQVAGAPACTIGSFVGDGPDVVTFAGRFDLAIFNPPFGLATEFTERALGLADHVAVLCRSNWAEGVERYGRIFARHPPLMEALFVERVPMQRGKWNPQGRTATAYSWFVFGPEPATETRKFWIPPGQRRALSLPDDVRRFTFADRTGAFL